jgi:hypothetical protein
VIARGLKGEAIMYKTHEQFATGQKIKLVGIAVIMAIVLIYSYVTTGSLTAAWWK